jgi:hypothetical protein
LPGIMQKNSRTSVNPKAVMMEGEMIRKVHVIFKTHLDIGFTDLASNVTERYFKQYIPAAIALAGSMCEEGKDRFIWTTGSWLVYEYLEHASGHEKKVAEQAILAGDLAWHALPFTTHTELLNADLFRFGLSLSQELDQRFGKVTHAAKMTDVPGHTRSIVPLLAEAGVELLHIGVNPGSAVPDVPPIFRWRAPGGQEVAVIYQEVYGSTFTMEGFDEALAFAHSDDNLGPQTQEQVKAVYQRLRKEFPGAEVAASTLDDYAEGLEPFIPQLPVLTQEIGDTWIHGVGSDPLKVMQFRELLRLQREWEIRGKVEPLSTDIKAFNRRLLMVAEHTWGLDIKTHLADVEHFSSVAFQKARSLPNFKRVESSWDEKRQYIDRAIRSLWNPALAKEASERLLHLKPTPPQVKGLSRKTQPSFETKKVGFQVKFDPLTGALIEIQRTEGISKDACRLGELSYHIFDAADYERVYAKYIRHSPMVDLWAKADFTKPGLEKLKFRTKKWLPKMRDFYFNDSQVLIFATFEKEAHMEFGAPELVTLEWSFDANQINLTLQVFNKSTCRIPEAMWLAMLPGLGGTIRCRMDKLGEWVDPLDVASRGNRALHAIGEGVEYSNDQGAVMLHSLDVPLMAPGEPPLMDFKDILPSLGKGPNFNLCNNLWGTNFPMWIEGDFKFRFQVEFS